MIDGVIPRLERIERLLKRRAQSPSVKELRKIVKDWQDHKGTDKGTDFGAMIRVAEIVLRGHKLKKNRKVSTANEES